MILVHFIMGWYTFQGLYTVQKHISYSAKNLLWSVLQKCLTVFTKLQVLQKIPLQMLHRVLTTPLYWTAVYLPKVYSGVVPPPIMNCAINNIATCRLLYFFSHEICGMLLFILQLSNIDCEPPTGS